MPKKNKQLDSIISSYSEKKEQLESSGGEYFAFWGLWLTASCIVAFSTNCYFVWMISTFIGILIQYLAVKHKILKHGYMFKNMAFMSGMWMFIAATTTVFFYILPVKAEIYSQEATSTFISIQMFTGLLITAALMRNPLFLAGSLVYLITPFIIKNPDQFTETAVFSVQFMTGFFLPGIWSMYNARRKKI